jgi:hypothetical protein
MRKLLLITAALSIPVVAHAEEPFKARAVIHYTAAQNYDVGDVDGHQLLMGKASGIASFPDGSMGTTTLTTYADYTKGSGSIPLLYTSFTTSDGSTIWWRGTGSTVTTGDRSEFKGVVTVISGTGKFAGAKGDGAFQGARLQAQLTSSAELYNSQPEIADLGLLAPVKDAGGARLTRRRRTQ